MGHKYRLMKEMSNHTEVPLNTLRPSLEIGIEIEIERDRDRDMAASPLLLKLAID